MRIEYHRTLIADHVRNEAFFRALKAVIEPGKSVVADIGAGTGLLGLMASKLGAKEVFLFETAEVAGVAAEVLKANKAKACHLIPCHSTEFRDKLAVDVIVSETLGNYALEENIIATLADARRRFLKSGGRVVPTGITQYVAPVIAPRIDEELRAWQRIGHGINLAAGANDDAEQRLCAAVATRRASRRWPQCRGVGRHRSDARDALETKWRGRVAAIQTSDDLRLRHVVDGRARSRRHAIDRPVRRRARTGSSFIFRFSIRLKPSRATVVGVELRSNSSEAGGTHLAWGGDPQERAGRRAGAPESRP